MRSRDIILEATRTVIGEAGFDGVSIAAVARHAGVSRQTVYSIFGTREDLVSQAISDRLTTLSGAFADLLAAADTPLALMVEILVQARDRIHNDPLLRVLTLSGGSNPIFDPGAAQRARDYAAQLIAPAVTRFPQLEPHLDFLADIGVHVGWSVLCLDDSRSRPDPELRAFLTTWLAPVMASLEPPQAPAPGTL